MFFQQKTVESWGKENSSLTKLELLEATRWYYVSVINWASGEMADTLALGASAARHGSSSLPSPTKETLQVLR